MVCPPSADIEQATGNVQGGFGQGYDQKTITPSEATKGDNLEPLHNQGTPNKNDYDGYGQTN